MSRNGEQLVPLAEVGDLACQDPPFPGRALITQAQTLGVKVDAYPDWAGRISVSPGDAKAIVDAVRAARAANDAQNLRRIALEEQVRTARTAKERAAYEKAYMKEQRRAGLHGGPTASARGRDAARRFAQRLDDAWETITGGSDVDRLERQLQAIDDTDTLNDDIPADTPDTDNEGVPR